MADSTKWVWLRDKKDLFVKATIVEEKGDQIVVNVKNTGETKTVNASEIDKVNPAQFDKVGDMAELTYLNEPSVINNLRERWFDGQIYTYSGLFLVAVNPYRSLPIYGEQTLQNFRGKRRDEAEPHIYAVAEQAFSSMVETKRDQSILITGESGAGKTENTKNAIQYLSSVTSLRSGTTTGSHSTGGIDARILQTNPILEAFGNAQTIRNSNSSRFGKFIKIQFGHESNEITGASIQWYLLEKSRVVTQHRNERNYHVFYQLLRGAPSALKTKLHIPVDATPADFTYLASGAPTIDGVDDAELYAKLVEAFRIMGFVTADVDSIMQLLAAVLLLGEIKYKATSADQGAVVDQTTVNNVASLLGVDPMQFAQSILQPRVKIGRENTAQSRNAAQAQQTTNAVAKALYEKLFGHIVAQLNSRLGGGSGSTHQSSTANCCIGVLDIAGFEIFEQNSFEQLCINYTNEKLQQFFNHHMFVLEQEEYLKENVNWDYIDYGSDLQPTINLIEQAKAPMGIFSCLNEESVFPNGSDASFSEKLVKQWDGKNPKFTPSRLNQGFVIDHYAQKVEYETEGWIEKNKDPMSDAVEAVLSESSHQLVRSFFVGNAAAKKSTITRTVAQRHKEQLNSLMEHLSATQPHFVRCIIPNTSRSPSVFDNHLVLDQLRYNGVLEGIRIARSGFPNRLEFLEFSRRYKALTGTASLSGPLNSQQTCATILQRIDIDPSQYKLGLSKVFFRNGVLAQLEHQLEALVLEQSLALQRLCRGALARMQAKREMHRRRATKLLVHCFKIQLRVAEDPWWKFNQGLKPLLMSKEGMDSSKKDLRMQKLESTVQKLREEQVELISSKNELRGELIASLHAKEDLSKMLDRVTKEQKERDETHELAVNAARSRDAASTSALKELSEKFRKLHEEHTSLQTSQRELQDTHQRSLKESATKSEEQIKELKAQLAAETERACAAQKQSKAQATELQTLQSSQQELESRVASLQKEAESAKADAKAAEERAQKEAQAAKEAKESAVAGAAAELAALQTTHKDTLAKLEDAERRTAKFDETKRELDKTREWLKKATVELKAAASMRRELDAATDKYKEEQEKSVKLESEVANAKKAVAELQSAATTNETASAEKQRLTNDLDTATDNLLKVSDELSRAQDKLKSTENELKSTKSKLSTALKEKERALADHKAALDEHSKNAQTQATALKAAQSQVVELQSVKSDLSSSQSRLAELPAIKAQLETAQKQLKELPTVKSQLATAQSQLKDLSAVKSQLESAKSQIEELQTAKSQLVKQLAEAKQSLEKRDSEFKTAQTKLESDVQSKWEAKLKTELERAQADAVRAQNEQKSALEDQLGVVQRELAAAQRDLTASRAEVIDTQKKLTETQKNLRVSQTQIAAQPAVGMPNFRNRFGNSDAELELTNAKHDLAQAGAQIEELKSEISSLRKENAQHILLRQKYEKLQRERAALAQEKSQLMAGGAAAAANSTAASAHTQSSLTRGQARELEIARARASEVKRLESELNVLKLKLVRSERDCKALAEKASTTSGSGSRTSGDATIESLKHRLRLAEIAKLQLSKTVHELSQNQMNDARKSPSKSSRDSTELLSPLKERNGEPLDPHDPPLVVRRRDVPQALRNISNDRRVSEHVHLAAEQVRNVDLEDALEIYKTRANEFHAKLEKAELVVESAVRAERAAKEQVEEYKNRLERIDSDHNAEIAELRRDVIKSKHLLDSRDAQIEDLVIKANFSKELQSQIRSMNNTLKELSGERDRLARDKAKLEKRLHDIVSSFDQQPRQLQEQLASLKQNEQHMMREHGELRWKLERKARFVDQLRRSLSDADSRIEQCRAEIDRLQANESAREIALRRAHREIAETNEKYLMAERELEQYRLSRRSSAAKTVRDTRPAFV